MASRVATVVRRGPRSIVFNGLRRDLPVGRRILQSGTKEVPVGRKTFQSGTKDLPVGRKIFQSGTKDALVGRKTFQLGRKQGPPDRARPGCASSWGAYADTRD